MLNVPEPQILDAAFSIWNYHCVEESLPANSEEFDLIVGLGTYDTRVAERCADIYHLGFSEKIAFTGGMGKLTKKIFGKSEAKAFTEIAIKNGVPKDHISLEEKALNTGENIQNIKSIFAQCKSAIFVATPQMQRRCRATVDQIWPEIKSVVTAPQLHLISQPTKHIDIQKVIHEIVGNYWRIRTYPKRGFQSEQDFDENADRAFQILIGEGYTKHLPKNWEDELAMTELEVAH